jgi:GDP-L-fucose synthase
MNIGTGKDITIKALAEIVQKIVWYSGKLDWDVSKPNWTPRKLTCVDKISNLWWKYEIQLEEWIKKTYDWYLENITS